MIEEMYEGDTIRLKLDLSAFNLPLNPDLTFVVETGKDTFIKKNVPSSFMVVLSEEDTVGLDGVYPCELRLNTEGITKVFWQKYIRIKNSITVDENYTVYSSNGKKYIEIIERLTALEKTEGMLIESITDEEIEILF